MSLPSSGSLSIGQIYQECGGIALTSNEDILRVRDNWWYADMLANFTPTYDDNQGYGMAQGIISTTHPFRTVVDVDVTYDILCWVYDGYNYSYELTGSVTIPQYANSTNFGFFYTCYWPYSCFVNSIYYNNVIPFESGNYLYSTTFSDYYGKTRYNNYGGYL